MEIAEERPATRLKLCRGGLRIELQSRTQDWD
jgi:hypothetical protein